METSRKAGLGSAVETACSRVIVSVLEPCHRLREKTKLDYALPLNPAGALDEVWAMPPAGQVIAVLPAGDSGNLG